MTQTEGFETKKYFADRHNEQIIEIKKMNEQELIKKWQELFEDIPTQQTEEYHKEQIKKIKVRLANIDDNSSSMKSKKAFAEQINRYIDEFKLKSKEGLMLYLRKVGSYDFDRPNAAIGEMKNQLKNYAFGLSFGHKVVKVDYGAGYKPRNYFNYIKKNKITENEDGSFDPVELAEFLENDCIDPKILVDFFEDELKRLEEIVEVNYVVLVDFFEELKERMDKKFGL